MIFLIVKPEGIRGCQCVQAEGIKASEAPIAGTLCIASIDGLQRFCTLRYALEAPPVGKAPVVSGTFLRIATMDDRKRLETNRKLAEKAMSYFDEETASLPYHMRAVTATFDFPRTHLLVIYRSSKNFEARRATASLHRRFNVEVEARQAGIREEVAEFGGIGPCGEPICCAGWLDSFSSVNPSLRLAKQQGISLNPTNLNGHCGRLKCCIRFEADAEKERNSEPKTKRAMPEKHARSKA